ncbi:MAG: hypothetical protein ABI823_11250 [Bryobacteraceae bacterium]
MILMVGVELVSHGWQYTMLTERGELSEESAARSLESLRERFSILPPTVIALGGDARAFRVGTMLTQMGHTVFFAGELAPELRPALLPLVEQLVKHSLHLDVPAGTLTHRDVVFRPVPNGHASMTFLVSLEGPDHAPVAGRALYFVGPVKSADEITGLLDASESRAAGSWTLALGLFRLWTMGELPMGKAAVAAA